MKDTVCDIIQIIVGIVFIGCILIAAVRCSIEQDKKEWNNGYCECGGHWVYEQAVGHAHRTSYVYRCDECGKTLEVWNTNVTEVTYE